MIGNKIVVFGSINMDIVNTVERYPSPGETIYSKATNYLAGGKGANQAVSLAVSGGKVAMLGAVGEDAFAQVLLNTIASYNVDVSHIKQVEGTSGLAFITVDASGENNIVLSPGANAKVTADLLTRDLLAQASAVLLQNEIPEHVNIDIMKMCRQYGVPIYYNPAPARALDEEMYAYIDTIILNESEAKSMTAIEVNDDEAAIKAARQLLSKGVKHVIVTLGEQGAIYVDSQLVERAQAYKVKAVDTTAAGDTFIGAYMISQLDGLSVKESLRFATAASALTVTKVGALQSIPSSDETFAFMKEQLH